jgi:hypothetical protein
MDQDRQYVTQHAPEAAHAANASRPARLRAPAARALAAQP